MVVREITRGNKKLFKRKSDRLAALFRQVERTGKDQITTNIVTYYNMTIIPCKTSG